MKKDVFTKLVIAVIAINLTILSLQNTGIFPKVFASKIQIKTNDIASNENYSLVPVNSDGTVYVKFKSNETLNVKLVGINTYDELEVKLVGINTRDELDVNVDEIAEVGSQVEGLLR